MVLVNEVKFAGESKQIWDFCLIATHLHRSVKCSRNILLVGRVYVTTALLNLFTDFQEGWFTRNYLALRSE